MDEKIARNAEAVVERELLDNGRGRVVKHPKFGPVRLRRATAEQEFEIGEARRIQWSKDMDDSGVRSMAEWERIYAARGIWSPEFDASINELLTKAAEAVGVMEVLNYKSLDQLVERYHDAVKKLLDEYKDLDEPRAALIRYCDLQMEPSGMDRVIVADAATGTHIDDALDEVDKVRGQITVLKNMKEIRQQLKELQTKRARLFVDAAESRADRAEQLARIYHCARNAETDQPLWPTFDALWKAPPEDVEFLLRQMNYFLYGIAPSFEDTMEKYGFTERVSATTDSSDDSRALPKSNSAGESVEATPSASSNPAE